MLKTIFYLVYYCIHILHTTAQYILNVISYAYIQIRVYIATYYTLVDIHTIQTSHTIYTVVCIQILYILCIHTLLQLRLCLTQEA